MVRELALTTTENHIMYDRSLVNQYAVNSAILFLDADSEGIRINMVDDEEGIIYGEGEESGEDYHIAYNEIDLEEAMWYRLQLLTPEILKTL